MTRPLLAALAACAVLVGLWLLRPRSTPPEEQPTFAPRAEATRLLTRPRSDAWRGGSSEDASDLSADFPAEEKAPAAGQNRRAALRPSRDALQPAEERAGAERPRPTRNLATRGGEAAAPPVAEVEPSPPDVAATSAEDLVAQTLGAVASLPLQDGKTESNGLAPAAAEDVTFDSTGAFFGPLARFLVVPPPDLPSFAGTVSFWVQPAWIGEEESNAAYFQWRTNTFANRIQIFKNGPYLRFLIANDEGVESGVGVNVMNWKAGDWHAITATWGDGVASLYIDGALAGAREYSGDIVIPPGTPWYIGSDHPEGAPGARSRIRGFQIYPRALSLDEVLQVVGATQPPPS